ncbi:MAG: MBL fold metallo-hydrolase [Anaerolineae bacterium]|jgi:L-ascorbate metabolism protein UlaG (beta-lactamase superfamily)
MDITWFGHSCFRLSDRGVTIVTDPPSDDMGYDRPRIRADVVTVSHEHPGHNNRIGFRGGPKIFDGPGEYEVKDVFITGIATYHDTRSGASRGPNTVFVFEFDGVTICHLGDLGHVPTQSEVEALSSVDVLLIPVGGVNTIDPSKASEVISLIEPLLVVPMHYKTPVEKAKLQTMDKFLKEMGLSPMPAQPELKVTKSSLPSDTQVVILDYQH